MFCIKICFLEPEPVGAELLRVEPEPKFFFSIAKEEEKCFGSATLLHGFKLHCSREVPGHRQLQCHQLYRQKNRPLLIFFPGYACGS